MKTGVSVIVVAEEFNENLRGCLKGLGRQTYRDFEVVAVVSKSLRSLKELKYNVKIYERADLEGNPSAKRNFAVGKAKGEVLAFLDDDCMAEREWTKEGFKSLTSLRLLRENGENIGAVCGPMLTPLDSPFLERVSGYLTESFLVFGVEAYRNKACPARFVDDYPTANFFIRRSDFLKLGGFDQRFWPGEDTKLCLDIINVLGKKIVYDPKVLVYHRRRPLFKKFLEQVARYGRQRGKFVRSFPKTSRKINYFVPSMFIFYLISLIFLYRISVFVFIPAFLYIIMVLSESFKVFVKERNVLTGLVFLEGVFLTHMVYGINFLRGLTK